MFRRKKKTRHVDVTFFSELINYPSFKRETMYSGWLDDMRFMCSTVPESIKEYRGDKSTTYTRIFELLDIINEADELYDWKVVEHRRYAGIFSKMETVYYITKKGINFEHEISYLFYSARDLRNHLEAVENGIHIGLQKGK